MAYDAAHNQTVLFGGVNLFTTGFFNDTWIWDGNAWSQQTPVNSPAPREQAGMAYDAARGQTVLFGGQSFSGAYSDTWVWDGGNWTQKTPAHNPGPRFVFAMTYDQAQGQVVLFGGEQANGLTTLWIGDGL
jgi:hypothetical protein